MNPGRKKHGHSKHAEMHKPQYLHPPTIEMPKTGQHAQPAMSYIPMPLIPKTEAQVIRDALVLPVYNNRFEPVFYGKEKMGEHFCNVLLPPPTLREIADRNMLGKKDYLLIGMGIREGNDPNRIMSFRNGLQKLYDMKIKNMAKMEDTKQLDGVKLKKKEADSYSYIRAERTNLEDFMAKYFGGAIGSIVPAYVAKNSIAKLPEKPKEPEKLAPEKKKNLENERKKMEIAVDREKFRRTMAGLIDKRLMMAYSVQELMPGNYNPMARMFFYEKLLLNAGTDYIAYYPALFDGQLSFGPFQFTPTAVEDLNKNFTGRYGCPNLPSTLGEKWGMSDHANAAVAFALKNIDRLSIALSKKPEAMERMLGMVEELSKTPEGKEKLQIFAIGLIGAMHYKPRLTEDALMRFATGKEEQWKLDSMNPHTSIMPYLPAGTKDVRRYYWNSAVVFLALPTYVEQVRKFNNTQIAKANVLPVGKN